MRFLQDGSPYSDLKGANNRRSKLGFPATFTGHRVHSHNTENFSLLYRGKDVILAPLYDLMCTIAYPGVSAKLAMKIAKRATLEEMNSNSWAAFAQLSVSVSLLSGAESKTFARRRQSACRCPIDRRSRLR